MNKGNHEIRFKCPLVFKQEIDNLKNLFSGMSLNDIYFCVAEYGLSSIQKQLSSGNIPKVEYFPVKSIRKLIFEEVDQDGKANR